MYVERKKKKPHYGSLITNWFSFVRLLMRWDYSVLQSLSLLKCFEFFFAYVQYFFGVLWPRTHTYTHTHSFHFRIESSTIKSKWSMSSDDYLVAFGLFAVQMAYHTNSDLELIRFTVGRKTEKTFFFFCYCNRFVYISFEMEKMVTNVQFSLSMAIIHGSVSTSSIRISLFRWMSPLYVVPKLKLE